MPKALCLVGMVISGVILAFFLPDLALGVPFGRSGGVLMDVVFVLCAVGLGYLSWATFREQD